MRRTIPILLSSLALVWAPAAPAAKAKADLTLSASAPGVVAVDDEFTATTTVRNRGPASGTAVTLTASLAGPLALVSVDASKGSCAVSGTAVTCGLGRLARGATVTVDFVLQALAPGDLRGSFRVRGGRADPALGNNAAGILTSVPRGDCTILGTAGNDRLAGTAGDDVICGLAGNDVLVGSAGNDVLYGGSGNDTLAGGLGDDRLLGGVGSDTATFRSAGGGVRADLARGVATGQGSDRLSSVKRLVGSRYRDDLRGSRGANVLSGGPGADRLVGRAGRDILRGGSGNDYLDGGRGIDRLYGARGRDRCLSGLRYSC